MKNYTFQRKAQEPKKRTIIEAKKNDELKKHQILLNIISNGRLVMKLHMDRNIIYKFSANLFFVIYTFLFSLSFAQMMEQPKALKSFLLPEKTTVSENISYATGVNGEAVTLDLYKPKNSFHEKLPVVIYIHGGGWTEGDKAIPENSYLENTIIKLVEKKYAVISINYTLINENVHFPKPIEDCKDAIRWVRKNAAKYNFDTNNIGLFGCSAGGHLSLLAAYTNDNEFVGNPELSQYSAKVNYVVDQFGPTDLNKLLFTSVGKLPGAVLGLNAKQAIEIRKKIIGEISGFDINMDKRKTVDYFKTISAISYVRNAVPTLIQHGNGDEIVPVKQSKELHNKLDKLNIQSFLTVVEGGVHGFRTTDQKSLDKIVDEVVRFIVSQKK
ncbi:MULTISPECIES: alpha/beta hydrolase [Chryseobacterium]|jgi:acetyl esterase/lipase|uniref:Acetyl esterase/lipase n=1 Tax=Chryseobacterium geocarposphaerae TaxID=1416776 RepID=A0ABU1LC07_9FLAO|nr:MULTISPECIES: alpha/beta hydrolase [Chryseobacterium]MDR6404070.1 acetyl esterase/lipase [Chryseobacterium geocarposphaerae]MDR6698411.1 acetyl esterase/lipase [Chryseobacterium ginsenosidimutans]